MKVAVVAHRKKSLDGGLVEVREVLARYGIHDPVWFEVPKSKKAPQYVRRALEAGVDRLFVWGGDGTVQRSLDVLAGTGVPMAVLPAGTGNLFAANMGIPTDLEKAVQIGLAGEVRSIDVGRINGERFGVMAGVGADALMIRDADGGLKDRLGRGAYVLTGVRNATDAVVKVKVDVDGQRFYSGKAGSVIVGNVGRVLGDIDAFDGATPRDGRLDIAVVTATSGCGSSTRPCWCACLTRRSVSRDVPVLDHAVLRAASRVGCEETGGHEYRSDSGSYPAGRGQVYCLQPIRHCQGHDQADGDKNPSERNHQVQPLCLFRWVGPAPVWMGQAHA